MFIQIFVYPVVASRDWALLGLPLAAAPSYITDLKYPDADRPPLFECLRRSWHWQVR